MRVLIVALACLLALPAAAQKPAPPGQFDQYVLSLSWSPTYCASRAGREDPDQCGGPKTYGFIVHGLWPQYAESGYPAECVADPQPVPDDVVAKTLPIMPSKKLIEHEWKRHGTCDGTSPAAYFAKTAQAFAAVKLPAEFTAPKAMLTLAPEQVEDMFIKANPGLGADQIAVVCRGRYAAELRVCLSKDMKFTDCGKSVRDRCAGQVMFPAVR